MDVALARLTDPADPRFAPLLRLYEAAIPPRERKDAATVRAMAASPVHVVGVAEKAGALLGFFLLYVGEAIALLEYLATDPAVRGQGLGAALYRAARGAAAGRPLLIEVETDRAPAPDLDLRRRRIGFYRRLGARRLEGVDFVLPLPGEGPPPPLDLLVDGAAGATAPAPVAAGWLAEIYTGVYGCAEDDPRLSAMVAALPGRVPLD